MTFYIVYDFQVDEIKNEQANMEDLNFCDSGFQSLPVLCQGRVSVLSLQ